ncbi:carboxypeptidase regulatory-like domain-containing protein [Amycolatopsis rhabdoformis]|uniref:Carboxypeptidase regulatory-like domain-containing protein n=1 Tax=Amycolatopsis rhabdoformis TaxID=1448059 RepID=A0ABZ1ICF8_9PSEU|nr:carboxypeptidase regulatory-like domain-containing protein [Amycolatopsis rhabdoformis]WSE31719.1 carboxypeptidase regulatory-like domain-containing protein [Amycolatopsis rhabdoformis]
MRVPRGRLLALIVPVLAGLALVVGTTQVGSTPSIASPSTASQSSTQDSAAKTVLDAAATSGDAKPAATAKATQTANGKTAAKAPTALYAPTGCNPAKPKPHTVTCNSLFKAGKDLRPLVSNAGPLPDSLGPADIRAAYDLPDGGAGKTVAIIDALGDSHAEADLAVYRAQYGLPACTTDNGCFRKVDQNGGVNYPADDDGWAQETALDLDAVSAACPACHILLVEGASTSPYDIVVGVDTAVRLGAKFISNSYGIDGEDPEEGTLDSHYSVPGVAMVASTGDHSYGLQDWPAANPDVVAAGGTNLYRDPANPRGWSEQAWDGAGSGCSPYEAKPEYQQDLATGCANRAIADVSAIADPASGFAIYDSGKSGGWGQVGGTSLSSPLIASMFALAGDPRPGTNPATYAYFNHGNDLYDVTEGSNGSCAAAPVLCTAGPGWDGPTGLGSPHGVATLAYTPQGTVAGHVKDTTGAPIAGATVTATGTVSGNVYHATTDAQGAYHLAIAADSYRIAVTRFGYENGGSELSIVDGQQASADYAVAKIATQTVSGTVTDGSGHGWPLYAKITVDGYPGGAIFTDPFSGRYSVDLPQGGDYQLHISAVQPGYAPIDRQVRVAGSSVRQNFTATADQQACSALGYGHAALTNFEGWLGSTAKDGWTITDAASPGWSFDNGLELFNFIGTGNYAIASPITRDGKAEDTEFESPVLDLSSDLAPALTFGGLYVPDGDSVFDTDLSLDGGSTWTTLAHHTTDLLQTQVSIPLPQAAGKDKVRVRFHFTGAGNSLAELDDVVVGSCTPTEGGLVAGVVTDANTGEARNDVTVADSATGRSAVSGPTADDAALPDGFYELFDTTGAHRYTASAPRYTSPALSLTTALNSVARKDVKLKAGQLAVGSTGIAVTKAMGQVANQTVKLTNTGTAPVHVSLGEHVTGFTAVDPSAAASWQPMANVPEFTYQSALGGYQGKVYSAGGMPMHMLVPSARSYVYDPVTAGWSSIADMPEPVMRGAAAFLNGSLYVVGGAGLPGILSTTYAYHPGTNTWSRMADLPAKLYGSTAATLGGKLYVVGGCLSVCGKDPVKSAFVYDPAHNSWSALPDYPEAESDAACAGIHGELVCAGGYLGGVTNIKSTYVFKPGATAWTKVADAPYEVSQMAYSGANGRLQLAGGETGAGTVVSQAGETAHTIEYDPVSDKWSSLPDLPQEYYGGGRGACALYQVGSFVPALRTTAMLPGYDQCGDDDAGWLSEGSTELDLAPGATAKVAVTVDSGKVTQPGKYTAAVAIDTDSPYTVANLPVSLQATPPNAWGELSGTVTDTASGAPVADATVQVCTMVHNGVCGEVSYTLKTDATGHYRLWLDKGYNPLMVTYAANGYQPQFRQVKVKAGAATVTDVTLPKI